MSYVLRPAVPGDAEEIAEIMHATLPLLPRLAVEYAAVSEANYRAWNTACLRSDFEVCAGSPESLCALKAVFVGGAGGEEGEGVQRGSEGREEEEGGEEIAGYAVWGWVPEAMSLLGSARAKIPYPENGNKELHQAFYSRLRQMEAKHKPTGDFYSLLFLLTSPHHQRRGVASLLISPGLAKANTDSSSHSPTATATATATATPTPTPTPKPIFLSASPMGLPLYRKLGFRELDRIELDLGAYGWAGSEEERVHVHVSMVKDALDSKK